MTKTEKLREEIIDTLHWKEYTFVARGGAVLKGSLTQASEERIAKQILRDCKEAGLEFVITHGSYGYEAVLEEIEIG